MTRKVKYTNWPKPGTQEYMRKWIQVHKKEVKEKQRERYRRDEEYRQRKLRAAQTYRDRTKKETDDMKQKFIEELTKKTNGIKQENKKAYIEGAFAAVDIMINLMKDTEKKKIQ